MAPRPDRGAIPIGDARKISEQRACPLVVVFGIAADAETFHVTTYGANKKLCRLAASFGKQFAEAILKGTVSPPETEPIELPEAPTTSTGTRQQEVE